jgi:hypothetical protein
MNKKLYKKLGQPIIDFTLNKNNWKHFQKPNHQGFVLGIVNLNNIDKELDKAGFPYLELFELEKQVVKSYGLDVNDIQKCTDNGIFLSYSEKGHIVRSHKDRPLTWYSENKRDFKDIINKRDIETIRFNILLQKPESGGDPIINEDKIMVDELETWVCPASRYYHTTTEVKGDKPRIMISFGYYLNSKQINKIKI